MLIFLYQLFCEEASQKYAGSGENAISASLIYSIQNKSNQLKTPKNTNRCTVFDDIYQTALNQTGCYKWMLKSELRKF